jgi:hypothetical protein
MRYILVALLLTGCNSQAGNDALVLTTPHLSRTAPATTSQSLLYVGGARGNTTYILSYPSLTLVGKIKGHATGLCSDTKGNVYVTTWSLRPPSGAILKYPHGATKPILTLADGYRPNGCAVDPKTGNLAATNLGTLSGSESSVAIWHHGKGTPIFWSVSNFFFYTFCGYDNHGNLFVDGLDKDYNVQFAELPKDGTLQNVSLDQSIEGAGNVQWDGKYVTVADTKTHELYRFTIASYIGTLAGSTSLTGWQTPKTTETWITGPTVVTAYGPGETREIGVWSYPQGGSPMKTTGKILGNGWVQSVTLSVAPPSADSASRMITRRN